MSSATSETPQDLPPLTDPSKPRQLLWGLLFGILFGFLLQKGGVAKYHVLIGVLLLRDFTVIQVMLAAILVGMIGIFALQRAGFVNFHLKPTRYLANSVGGIIFGIGFALAAYCPGTGAAALGQGNLDALGVVAGMIIGSFLFAEMSGWIGRKVNPIGERGEMTWPQLLHLPPLPVTIAFAAIILGVLILLVAKGDAEHTSAAWSPYLVGALIGVLSWFTFLISNKPLGASSAYARISGMIGKAIAPTHTMSLKYFQDNKPKIDWEVMLVIGVIIGAVIAAWTGNELVARWVPPMWADRFGDAIAPRLIVACLGGILMAFGARLAGGCTSGHGISGAMQLSVASWIALTGFFVGGVITAMLLFNT